MVARPMQISSASTVTFVSLSDGLPSPPLSTYSPSSSSRSIGRFRPTAATAPSSVSSAEPAVVVGPRRSKRKRKMVEAAAVIATDLSGRDGVMERVVASTGGVRRKRRKSKDAEAPPPCQPVVTLLPMNPCALLFTFPAEPLPPDIHYSFTSSCRPTLTRSESLPLAFQPLSLRPPIMPQHVPLVHYSGPPPALPPPRQRCRRCVPVRSALGPLERTKMRKLCHAFIRSAALFAPPLMAVRCNGSSLMPSVVAKNIESKGKAVEYNPAAPSHEREPKWLASPVGRPSLFSPPEATTVGSGEGWLRTSSPLPRNPIRQSPGFRFGMAPIRVPGLPPMSGPPASQAQSQGGHQAPLKAQLLAILRMRANQGPGEACTRFKKWVHYNAWMRRDCPPAMLEVGEQGCKATSALPHKGSHSAPATITEAKGEGQVETNLPLAEALAEATGAPTPPATPKPVLVSLPPRVSTKPSHSQPVGSPLASTPSAALQASAPTVAFRSVPILLAPRPKLARTTSLPARLEGIGEIVVAGQATLTEADKAVARVTKPQQQHGPPTPPPSPPNEGPGPVAVAVVGREVHCMA